MIGLAIGALMFLPWQVAGQPPERAPEADVTETVNPGTQPPLAQKPEADAKEPKEIPATSPLAAEPAVEKAETTSRTKDDVETSPARTEKSGTEPAKPQQSAAKPPPPQVKPVPRPAPLIFGTTATRHVDLAPFPQWTGALKRYYQRRAQVPGPCQATYFNACHMQRWNAMLRDVRGQTRERQLNLVNQYMNTHRYIVDPINWGVTEYWAIPQEFLKKFGDCEDYAIAKYLSLLALGWSPDNMRIVVLQDLNLRVMHAVLIVNFQGKNMLLDNQATRVVDANKIHHYRPIYSLNEKGWWRHSPARRTAG